MARMTIPDLLHVARVSLLENRLRSLLTLLGLAIGVTSLITVMSVIQAANDYVADKIANLGANVFQATKLANISDGIDAFIKSFRRKDIRWEDYLLVRQQVPSALRIGAQVSESSTVRHGVQSVEDTIVEGATANMIEIGTREIAEGRFFTEQEQVFARRVCVLGADICSGLFPGVDPLDREVRISGQPFRVVGVCKKVGEVLGQTQDNFAIIPLPAFTRIWGTHMSLDLFIQTSGPATFQDAMDETRIVLRNLRGRTYSQPDDFTLVTSDTTIGLFHDITDNFFLVFLLLSAVAAIVGGIVIMNIMLVSVTERTVEVGVRRAMGASRRNILTQFLTESVLLCLTGGVTGVLAGLAAAAALGTVAGLPVSVKFWVAFTGVGLSSAIGLFFGIYPAWKAAGLDPVEALRHEV